MNLRFWPGVVTILLLACMPLLAGQRSREVAQGQQPESQAEPGSKPGDSAQDKAQAATQKAPEEPGALAWYLLETAAHSDKVTERTIAVRALGLIPDNSKALKVAEAALLDDKPEVRSAAASALGDLQNKTSIPKLRSMLEDKEPAVVLAATHALQQMHDEAAYEVYYEILTSERKVSKGLISDETSILHDPKKLVKLGIEEGISNAVPFGGYGVEAYRLMSKNEGARMRAAAAKELADDPDPASTHALANAAGDSDWTVRASALEALARRGDPSTLKTVELYLYDDKSEVKYNAAAATLRLLAIQEAAGKKRPQSDHTRQPGSSQKKPR